MKRKSIKRKGVKKRKYRLTPDRGKKENIRLLKAEIARLKQDNSEFRRDPFGDGSLRKPKRADARLNKLRTRIVWALLMAAGLLGLLFAIYRIFWL
jgi:hypothetical protein